MGRAFTIVVLSALGGTLAGCRAQQLQMDQDQFRTVLLDMYTNQIMDNLIRAYNGMPMIQLDYTNVTGQITQQAQASYMGTQTTVGDRTHAAPTISKTIQRTFTNVANFGANASQSNQLAVTANPVINNNEVYNAYLQFVSMPNHLVATCDPPPPGAAHISRKCNKMYYWVPCEYKTDFLRLSLVTTAMRGQPLTIPDAYERTVTGVLLDKDSPGTKQHRFVVLFNKKLPNGSGTLKAVIGGTPRELPLQIFTGVVDRTLPSGAVERNVRIAPGEETDRLFLTYSERQIPVPAADFIKSLVNQAVKIDLDFFKPAAPTTDNLLESIRNTTNLIWLNQFNSATRP